MELEHESVENVQLRACDNDLKMDHDCVTDTLKLDCERVCAEAVDDRLECDCVVGQLREEILTLERQSCEEVSKLLCQCHRVATEAHSTRVEFTCAREEVEKLRTQCEHMATEHTKAQRAMEEDLACAKMEHKEVQLVVM